MRIYYLQNASCEDLVKTLSLMLKEKERVEIKETSPGGVQTASVTDKKSVFSTNLSADKATNSIIMYVTDEEYAELKKIISYLDVQRKQILISAVIAEVSLTKLLNVGVRWQALVDKFAGGYQGGLTQEQLYGVLASGNFILGGVGQSTTTITINGQQVTVPNVFALISLLQSDSDFNLLSCPRVVTLDHKEARLIVGKVIPFATGVKFDSLNNPIITYDYKDVGLDLKITPHINQSEKINLEVNQKIQEVIDYLRPNAGNLSYVVPITSQREFQTSVTVNENQTIVIGGLVTRKTLDNIKKLPILGDLPIFGQAFRDSSKTGEKIILFAFITPHIVNSQEQIDNVTQQYQKAIKESVFIDKKEPLDIIPKDDILSDDKTKNLP
jgi:general secretion pathway protein D